MVWAAAAVAFLARFPSLLWPLRPDEAGFLMVARAWQPEPDSLYGRYWVDRPPPILWLVQATDRIGGPYAHRLVGALACSLLVLAAAAAAREVVVRAGVLDPAAVRRLAGWVAVATAALVSNAEIDPVAAKGELFGIPLVMASCWLALRAVRRVSAGWSSAPSSSPGRWSRGRWARATRCAAQGPPPPGPPCRWRSSSRGRSGPAYACRRSGTTSWPSA